MSNQKPLVKFFEIEAFIISFIVSIASAAIRTQIIWRVGFSHNSSIIGALIAMAIAGFPINFAVDGSRYRFAETRLRVLL